MGFADSSLPLGDKTYLSLSLWERLGEGITQIVVQPPHPRLSLRERGSFLFEINPSPSGKQCKLIPLPLREVR